MATFSIYDDEKYENYDFDVLPPRQRLATATALEDLGFRQVKGSA